MTSSVKSGFSTINRLLGKKSKDDIPADPSTYSNSSSGSPSSMFSRSMSHLDTTSQYNKIVPLTALNNAPFEQTFRITVALPRGQLYVVRVGAKTKLHQILAMTCTAKQLDADKYEFRHPADNSMVFSNEFTIGEVGLNEIRLVHVSDSSHGDQFSSADLGRMRAGNRNSYAAPPSTNGTASRNGHAAAVANSKSPYSSTNSLNSIESSAHSRPVYQRQQSPMANGQPVAPARKKRAAPRPPSQGVIPEDSTAMRHKNFHVSSPNLTQHLQVHAAEITPRRENGGVRPLSMFQEPATIHSNHASSSTDLRPRRLSRADSNVSSSSVASGAGGPRYVPRRKKAAPAPPPRSSRESITPQPPVPTPRTITLVPTERLEVKDIPIENVSKTLLNSEQSVPVEVKARANVFKEDTPMPIVEHTIQVEHHSSPPAANTIEMEMMQNGTPVSIAIVTSNAVQDGQAPKKDGPEVRPIKTTEPQCDYEEETRMNIYNLNTGKCLEADVVRERTRVVETKLIPEAIEGMILEELNEERLMIAKERPPQLVEDLYAEVKKPPKKLNAEVVKEQRSDSPSWTYTLPAPPHFADGNNNNLLMVAANGNGVAASPQLVPTETFNTNVYYNYSEHDDGDSIAARSMTTTVVSDVLITPVIKERIPLEQPLMLPLDDEDDQFHNNSESSDFNSSSTLTSASPNNLHGDEERRKKLIINSDIEDGYHGPQQQQQQPMARMYVNQGLIETLEKRREKFIENELEQLVSGESVHSEEPEIDLEREQIIRFDENKSKSTVIAAEEQEPTISRSPVEDGLPRTREFNNRTSSPPSSDVEGKVVVQRPDSVNSNNPASLLNDSTTASSSGEDSLEVTRVDQSHSQINLANQSFEQRRSSFLAELENSKNMINRRTSNELSISDAPSALQSIEVMRSIMMSAAKKEPEVKVPAAKVREDIPVVEEEIKQVSVKPVEKEKPVEEQKSVEKKPVIVETTPWKYTGPPKINLGSWSERPKIQVCLKTDSDYHHSLQTAADKDKEQLSLDDVKSTPTESAAQQPQQQEKEKLPIVRSMELKKNISVPEDKTPISPEPVVVAQAAAAVAVREPFVKAKVQRPVSMYSNRFTPTVRGFSAAKGREEDDEIRSTKINPILMRSNSNVVAKANGGIAIRTETVSVDTAIAKPPPPETLEKPVVFSQSTLRRTGLKDRILSEPEVKAVVNPPLKSILVQKTTVQEVASSPVSPPPPPPPPTVALKASGSLLNPLARLAAPAPVDEKDSNAAQKPIVRGVVKKTSHTPEVDPRTQLLDSIRNFSFNQLRKM